MSAADFDRIAANMRQCSIFPGSGLEQRRDRRSRAAALESRVEALAASRNLEIPGLLRIAPE
jgi:hypothetical protein